MAASEIYDHQNRSGVMGWLYITYLVAILSSRTVLRRPWPSTPHPHPLPPHSHPHPHTHYNQPDLYQIDTPSFLTQSLSQQPAMYSIS